MKPEFVPVIMTRNLRLCNVSLMLYWTLNLCPPSWECVNSFFFLFSEQKPTTENKKVGFYFIKQVLATTPHETPTIRTLAPHHKNYTSSTNQTRRTLLEKQGRAHKRCTPVDPHSWMCKSGTTSTNLHTAAM